MGPATFLTSQNSVLATTAVIFLLSGALATLLTKKYFKNRNRAYLFWSLGLWCFAAGVMLEVLFALNVYSPLLAIVYLLIVVVLVELLAMGSMELISTKWLKQAYTIFAILATLYVAYTLETTSIGNILVDYVVAGVLPISIVISSSIATFVAAVILFIVALKGYIKTKNRKLLSIIAGVVIVSVAGTLYLVQYPAFLYIAEFIGILLLWLGFI
jgi:hypothetical protein